MKERRYSFGSISFNTSIGNLTKLLLLPLLTGLIPVVELHATFSSTTPSAEPVPHVIIDDLEPGVDSIRSGRITLHEIESKALKTNKLGTPSFRDVLVYTPPDYRERPDQRYPVLYLLHGYGGNASVWLESPHTQGFNIRNAMDSLIKKEIVRGYIVVMPDCSNRFGGTWYVNSTPGGLWEDFFTEELVPFIDSTYRTRDSPAFRGIAGHSMGGYGALRLAFEYPDFFGSAYAMSSINLVDDRVAKLQFPKLLDKLAGDTIPDDLSLFDKLLLSKATAFVPDTTSPFYCEFLYKTGTEEPVLDTAVWNRWSQQLMKSHIQTFKAKEKPIEIMMDHGSDDMLVTESREFSNLLSKENIKHRYREYQGGHTDHLRARLEGHCLPYFSGIWFH